jgi:hypothetical protein
MADPGVAVARFVALRAVAQSDDTLDQRTVPLLPPTSQQVSPPTRPPDAGAWTLARRAATLLAQQKKLVSPKNPLELPIEALDRWLTTRADRVAPADVSRQVEALTDRAPADLIETQVYKQERTRLAHTLVAQLLRLGEESDSKPRLLRMLRIAGLIERLARGAIGLQTADHVATFLLNGIVLLPLDAVRPLEALARAPGIGDLNVIRQALVRYEHGEIAHIENVLQGEWKERNHRLQSERDEYSEFETETEKEERRELETTERFELQREVGRQITEDTSLQAGLSVTASYGPVVSVSADVGYSTSTSKQESERQTSEFSRDVVERSASRVREKTRQFRTTRSTIKVDEVNLHRLENADGDKDVVGIYRWVDKIYRAQVVTYGRRLLLEFAVPEPAAFYLHARDAQAERATSLPPEPQPPKRPRQPPLRGSQEDQPLRPIDINQENYATLASQYGATDVEPAPPETTVVEVAFEKEMLPKDQIPANFFVAKTGVAKIPAGYAATAWDASFLTWRNTDAAKGHTVALHVSTSQIVKPLPGPANEPGVPIAVGAPLSNETGDVALGFMTDSIRGYSAIFKITCKRLPETLDAWKLRTFSSITTAYEQQRSAYDAAIAQAKIQNGVRFSTTKAADNRRVEQAELRKSVLALLMSNDVGAPDTVVEPDPTHKFPRLNITGWRHEAVQFFEQSFEWPQMTYVFYPYFWGREAQWVDASTRAADDPLFETFLRAGAARVVIPVRPGFESAVLLFLATGLLWSGSGAPQVGDPLYVSAVGELQEGLGGVTEGTTVGEPWEVNIPTSLVILASAELPPL